MPDFSKSYRVLRRLKDLDVRSLAAYRSVGGYQALESAVRKQTPERVIEQVLDAKLRGRGGAGRLTGEKWRITRRAEDNQKYVICNAYDADSRSYAVRSLLAQNPHQVIEGIVLAAYAVGASEAYLFTRSLFSEGIAAVQAACRWRRRPRWPRRCMPQSPARSPQLCRPDISAAWMRAAGPEAPAGK